MKQKCDHKIMNKIWKQGHVKDWHQENIGRL